MKKFKRLFVSISFLAAFAVWTALVFLYDVRAIGPNGSRVGFATLNGCFHKFTGVNMWLYTITDWLSLIPVFIMTGFAVLGLLQWIKGKNILKVDFSILALGVFYIITLAAYLLFEEVVINYRPTLINGILEASYPSSTTLLVLCVMITALIQFNLRIRNSVFRALVATLIIAFIIFMVGGRIVSGVHWITDIIGGILLSFGLIYMYWFICGLTNNAKEKSLVKTRGLKFAKI